MIFSRKAIGFCWICGSVEQMTGEHKIKRTDLNRHWVSPSMFHSLRNGEKKLVQGLNSKQLKFENCICSKCNNQTTQSADRSYDKFWGQDLEATGITETENELTFSEQVDLARYFAKHLGCALSYQKFPIPKRLSRFVRGHTNKECISVYTRIAPFCWQREDGSVLPLNGLGGAFLVLHDSKFKWPLSYQSSYMTDGLQFTVKMHLSTFEALEIRTIYQNKMGHFVDAFDDDEAKHRGL